MKVGDKVRIELPHNRWHDKIGTIINYPCSGYPNTGNESVANVRFKEASQNFYIKQLIPIEEGNEMTVDNKFYLFVSHAFNEEDGTIYISNEVVAGKSKDEVKVAVTRKLPEEAPNTTVVIVEGPLG